MATYTEYLHDALEVWRYQERQLARLKEDGCEDYRIADAKREAAQAFAKAVDTHLMAVDARSHR